MNRIQRPKCDIFQRVKRHSSVSHGMPFPIRGRVFLLVIVDKYPHLLVYFPPCMCRFKLNWSSKLKENNDRKKKVSEICVVKDTDKGFMSEACLRFNF